MVSVNNKTKALSWLNTILDNTCDGDVRSKATSLLSSDLSKESNLERVRDLIAVEYNVDVE